MSAPRRVLAVHPLPDRYGADRMLLASLRALVAAGSEVTLAVPGDGPLLAEVRQLGVPVEIVSFPVLRKALLRPGALARLAADAIGHVVRATSRLRHAPVDLVYVNTLTLPTWLLAARFRGVPVVCHVRELEEQLSRPAARLLTAPLLAADAVVANSAATAAYLHHCWPRLRRRTTVVYNGFDLPPAAPAIQPTRPCRRLLVVGRLSPRKGQDVAVEALRHLVADGRDVELVLAGDVFPGYEWYERDLRAAAATMPGRVQLVGYRTPVWPELAAADVVLVPSRLEPFGSVAVEALAARRPLIASRIGGLPEVVTHGVDGLLVVPDSPEALAAASGRLLDDAAYAARLAAAGERRVRQRFTAERYAEQLCAVLAGAAERRSASPRPPSGGLRPAS